MITQIKYQNFFWIKIYRPTKEDLNFLKETFNFHSVVLEELKKPSIRAHVDHFNDYLYFVYHIPIFEPHLQSSQPREIDFIVTSNHLITVTYKKIEILEDFFKELSNDFKKQALYMERGPGGLLAEILKRAIHFSLRELVHIGEKIHRIEKEIFSEKVDEIEKVRRISLVKRDILNFQLVVRPHQKLLHSLFLEGSKFFGKRYKMYFSSIESEEMKVIDTLQNYRDIIESLEITNSNIINIKINRIMKIFTVLAFITFPLTFLSSLFGMNVRYAPFLGKPGDFWIIAGAMLFFASCMFVYFRKRKWI